MVPPWSLQGFNYSFLPDCSENRFEATFQYLLEFYVSISMEIDWSSGVVEFRVTEQLTAMTIVDGFALLNASPQGAKLRGIVWDVRGADLSKLDSCALNAALRASPLPENTVPGLRIAAVTDDTGGQKVGEKWVKIGRSLDAAARRVFDCVEEARVWVKQNACAEASGATRAGSC